MASNTGYRSSRRAQPLAYALGLAMLAAPLPLGAADGVMILRNLTLPRGGAWLDGALGGHWWQTDQVLGICRVDPLTGANPPFNTTNCNGTAKSGGQIAVGNTPTTATDGKKYVYVPDASSKSVAVVRFVYNPANETLSSPLTMSVPNVTSVGGGSGGGRPVAVVVAPNGTDLYVGYLKSGDIMKVTGAMTVTTPTPVVAKVGSTSDGRGLNALVLFKNDLYLAENSGLSKIPDPSGVARAACNSASPCTASLLNPQIASFPGGLAADANSLYIGNAPLNGTPGSVLRWTPATGTVDTYSANVPAYTSTFDGVTRNQYSGPLGIGVAPNGDLYVADDPTYSLVAAVLPTLQGHLWRVPAGVPSLSATGMSPTTGPSAGNTAVTITGTGFSISQTNPTLISFGTAAALSVRCASVTSCTATSPGGLGTVDVTVTVPGEGTVVAGQFSYVTPAPPATGPVVTSISPVSGLAAGGTMVTISGSNFSTQTGQTLVNFGANAATNVSCSTATLCTAVSPAGTGTVDVLVTVNAQTSAAAAGDRFTYGSAVANLYAWGITAPKGGMVFIPGSLGGHWWSSDHSAGFCRQDPVPGTTLHALNYSVCDDGTIGSPGQAVYDARLNADGRTHYVYVPDNAVKSTAVWRLTFDPSTETIAGAPEAMIPLADVRTLKPNGMALGPDGNLYVTDLTEMNIRQVTNPNGDPRLQTISIVAVTGDGRGANGTIGFIGNRLYISENRAASWIDITRCPTATGPCATTPIPLPSGAFVAGVATDPVNNFVYAADSPGGANATIWRYNVATGVSSVYLQGGSVPAAGSPNATVYCALTCTRPWDPALTPGATAGFSFAFGLNVDPANGALFITEDPTAGARAGHGRAWVAPLIP